MDSGVDSGMPDAGPPYSVTVFDGVRISSPNGTDAGPNLQHASADFSLPGAPFTSVTLVVDLASSCYPFSGWAQNPPPTGENWPADCDAFDRNFELYLELPDGGPSQELVRAITPFGGPLHFEQDITDSVFNGGDRKLGVSITTWSDGAGQVSGSNGGWNVTARIDAVPGPAPRNVVAVIPLVYRSDNGPDAGGEFDFTLPSTSTYAFLEYRVTGHGGAAGTQGCIGPAEEFCQRTHHVRLDGEDTWMGTPWRTDCDQLCTVAHYGSPGFDYCQENPCGNMNSVRAPRANWCPGSVTPPIGLDSATFGTPGAHHVGYTIDNAVPGGEWRVSATVFAYGP